LRGYAHLPALLGPQQCETLRAMFDEDRLFAKTVTMNKSHFGKGVYRYFAAPLPSLVDAVRHLIYPHAAEIANRWQHMLNDNGLYPATWSEFHDRCAQAGQTTPSPLLLRYEAGGFNAPHQDLRGRCLWPETRAARSDANCLGDPLRARRTVSRVRMTERIESGFDSSFAHDHPINGTPGGRPFRERWLRQRAGYETNAFRHCDSGRRHLCRRR
jgi:hypothetical protein